MSNSTIGYGDGCSAHCGYCGMCTLEWDSNNEDDRPIFCAECDKDIRGPYEYKLSLPNGYFCGTACADAYELKFSAHLRQRRIG